MYQDKESLIQLEKSKSIFNFSISFKQFKLMLIIMLLAIPAGMTVGFSAIALPELNLNLDQSSWFASVPSLGALLGNILAGYIIDLYGRKKAFFVNTISAFTGGILLAGCQEFLYMLVGLFCLGISQGAATLPATVYVAESVAPLNLKFRSSLTSWIVLAVNIGIFVVYLLGYIFRYNYVALIGAMISLTSTILVLIFIPESPTWLDQKGRHREAEIARYKLGFKDSNIDCPSSSYQPIEEEYRESLVSYLSKIKRKDVYKPLFITMSYFFLQQFCGTQVFTAYMVDVIEVKSITLNPYMLTVVSGAIFIMSQITYTITLPHVGIRKMGIFSSLGTGLSLIILAVCIALGGTATWYSYILDLTHVVAVWLNAFIGGLGIATIPYTIISEVFPSDAKGLATIPIMSVGAFYFSILMIYPYMLVFSTYAVYFWFAAISFLTAIFVYLYIPETVDRTLDEISNDFLKSDR